MKKIFAILGAIALSVPMFAQKAAEEDEGYKFDTIKMLPITSVKNQNNAGTCWSYSGIAFLEAELLRMGKGEYDLSEMYVVEKTYNDRAMAAVRTHGDVSFSQGGAFNDVIYCLRNYGMVPDAVMPAGAAYGDTLSNHTELSALTDVMVEAIAKGKLKKLQKSPDGQPLWLKSIAAVHEIYLGKIPESFTYKGKPRPQPRRLCKPHLILTPSLLPAFRHRNSGQLALGSELQPPHRRVYGCFRLCYRQWLHRSLG